MYPNRLYKPIGPCRPAIVSVTIPAYFGLLQIRSSNASAGIKLAATRISKRQQNELWGMEVTRKVSQGDINDHFTERRKGCHDERADVIWWRELAKSTREIDSWLAERIRTRERAWRREWERECRMAPFWGDPKEVLSVLKASGF